MSDPKNLSPYAIFERIIAGEATPEQIAELKERFEKNPEAAQAYSKVHFHRKLTRETIEAYKKLEGFRSEVFTEAQKSAQEDLRQLREAAIEHSIEL